MRRDEKGKFLGKSRKEKRSLMFLKARFLINDEKAEDLRWLFNQGVKHGIEIGKIEGKETGMKECFELIGRKVVKGY